MNRIAIVAFLASFCMISLANAQSWRPPAEDDRCPSKWGAGDERGSANHMGSATVLRATQLIREGEVVELGHVLHGSIPLGDRHFDIYSKPSSMNPQSNRRGSNEELVATELGQVGTQFDGFSHQTIGDTMYNCFRVSETMTRAGFTHLGIENVGMLMTRGVLLDIAKLKGVDMLPADYEITIEDLQEALANVNLALEPGDAVIINTGWGRLWTRDVERFLGPAPGIGVPAAEWLVTQDPMLVGADNQPVEIQPNPDPEISLPIHQIMLAVNGIHLLERMNLEELAALEVYEFAFVMQPLKIQGATGSTVAPAAIY
jgi:kynurenine formamidase